jgi:predicted nucleic acid-binding protein
LTVTTKNKWLIDTDVLIDYFRGLVQATAFLEKIIQRDSCYLSSITVAELFAGIREGKERHLLESFLQSFNIIPIDQTIAQTGGLYKRDYSKSHGLGLADAIIAATSDLYHAELVTLNSKHFPMKKVYIPYTK